MSDYDTGKDIVEDMLSRAGELQLDFAELSEEAKRYANRGYFTIIKQFPWLFAEGYPPMSIMTAPKMKLTVTVEQGATIIQTDLPVPNEYGYRIVVENEPVPFRVVPDPSQALNTVIIPVPYPFSSGENVSAFLYRDEYLTPNVMIGNRLKNISRPHSQIAIVGYEEFDVSIPTGPSFGAISMATYYNEEYLKIGLVPEGPELLELHYSKRPPRLDFSGDGVTDTPILPPDERWMIADYGLYFLMKDHGDDRADSVAQVAAGRVLEIKDRQISKMSPRMFLPIAFNPGVRF
jgi:hypothetical protein